MRTLGFCSAPLRSCDIRDKVRNGILALFSDQLYFSATKQRRTKSFGTHVHNTSNNTSTKLQLQRIKLHIEIVNLKPVTPTRNKYKNTSPFKTRDTYNNTFSFPFQLGLSSGLAVNLKSLKFELFSKLYESSKILDFNLALRTVIPVYKLKDRHYTRVDPRCNARPKPHSLNHMTHSGIFSASPRKTRAGPTCRVVGKDARRAGNFSTNCDATRASPRTQCSKRPNPLKLTLVGISRFSGALVGPSRGSRHMTSLHVKTKHTCHVTRPT